MCVCWYRCSMSPRSSQPRWRRPYNTNIKSLHPPALTFVLAEPKQAAALHSATSRLPSVLRSASPQSETSSMASKAQEEESPCEPASHPTNKVLRSEEVACPQEPTNQDPSSGRVLGFPCLHGANSSLPIHTTLVAGKVETTTTTTGDTQANSSEVVSAVGSDPNPATTVDPPQSAPNTTEQILANKRSWLTAFAWRKEQEPEANPPVPESNPTRSDSPEGQSKQDPPVHPLPQPVDAVVAVAQTKEALRPQDSTSQHRDVALSQPGPEAAKHNVPKPQPGPLDALQPADKSGSTASLGTTSTKFTLGMPLLGRPKVPLDRAMADARKEDSGSAQKVQSESRPKKNKEQGVPPPHTNFLV